MIGVGLAISLTSGVRRKASIALNGSGTVDITVGDGAITITVSGADYAHHNGTHGPFATADLDTGPISVVAPVITGMVGPGEVLTSAPGLWLFESGDAAAITTIWQRDAVDIPGETGTTYTTTVTDEGTNVGFQETATNTAGSRSQDSNVVSIPVSSSFADRWFPIDIIKHKHAELHNRSGKCVGGRYCAVVSGYRQACSFCCGGW